MNQHWLRFDKSKKITIFDVETYNLFLSFKRNKFWQLAYMTVQGDKIIRTANHYVSWKNCNLKIGEEAAKITKFDKEKYDRLKVDESLIRDEIFTLFDESDYLIAHNGLNFDIFLIRDWAIANKKPWKHYMNKMIDTNAVAKGIKMGVPYKAGDDFLAYQYRTLSVKVKGIKTRLEILGPENNIEHDYENTHDAFVDVDLNRKVWNILKYQIEL